MRFKDKVVVASGSGGPMGRGIAAKFVAEGAKVVLNDISANRLNETVEFLRQQGGEVIGVRGDAMVRHEVIPVVEAAFERFGKVDILLNIVGGVKGQLMTPLLEIKEEDWDAVMALNLRTAFHFTQLIAPRMIEAKYGKIVNISSVVATHGCPRQAHYSSAKAGIIAFTKTAARELAPFVNVNCIVPGLIQTSLMERIGDDVSSAFDQTVPLKRFGRPEDVANAVAFFASEESSYITGQALLVAGGLEGIPFTSNS